VNLILCIIQSSQEVTKPVLHFTSLYQFVRVAVHQVDLFVYRCVPNVPQWPTMFFVTQAELFVL